MWSFALGEVLVQKFFAVLVEQIIVKLLVRFTQARSGRCCCAQIGQVGDILEYFLSYQVPWQGILDVGGANFTILKLSFIAES